MESPETTVSKEQNEKSEACQAGRTRETIQRCSPHSRSSLLPVDNRIRSSLTNVISFLNGTCCLYHHLILQITVTGPAIILQPCEHHRLTFTLLKLRFTCIPPVVSHLFACCCPHPCLIFWVEKPRCPKVGHITY